MTWKLKAKHQVNYRLWQMFGTQDVKFGGVAVFNRSSIFFTPIQVLFTVRLLKNELYVRSLSSEVKAEGLSSKVSEKSTSFDFQTLYRESFEDWALKTVEELRGHKELQDFLKVQEPFDPTRRGVFHLAIMLRDTQNRLEETHSQLPPAYWDDVVRAWRVELEQELPLFMDNPLGDEFIPNTSEEVFA